MSNPWGVLFLLFVRDIYGTLLLCDSHNGYLEIEKGKGNNTFIESGVSQDLLVQWRQKFPGYNPTDIGECPGGSYVCTSQLAPVFTFSRTVNTVSVTVDEPAANNKQIFYTMNLLLLIFSGSTKLKENSCPLDLINPPLGASCTIQFSGTTWAVTGSCTVTKVLSERGRYYCRVYQVNQEPSSLQSLVGNFTMTTSKNGNTEYFDGYCQINFRLPPAGKYNYSIVIVPGERQVSPVFNGSNEIKLPQSPFHNCSQNIPEGQTLKCLCNVREVGNPPGVTVWKGTTSSELQLSNVNRTYNGMVYVCTVMWNNTAIQQELYTLTVNYKSSVLIFKIDNKEDPFLSVNENSNVSIECRADGRPLPIIRLIKRNIGTQEHEIAVNNNAQELHHTISSVTCESAGRYVCQSENIIGADEKDIQMIIFCAPRRAVSDSYSGTFESNEAKLQFEMISYPAPDLLSLFYIGSSLNDSLFRQVELENVARSECTSGNLYRYMVTCTVTLVNKTAFTAGFYTATFNNGLGSVSLTFEIKEEIVSTGRSQPEVAGPVAGGVIGALIVIVLVVGIIILVIRRKRKGDERGLRMNTASASKTNQERGLEKMYDQLQSGDINSLSIYQALGNRQASSVSTHLEDQVKSHVYEVPIELHENTRQTHQREIIYQNNTSS